MIVRITQGFSLIVTLKILSKNHLWFVIRLHESDLLQMVERMSFSLKTFMVSAVISCSLSCFCLSFLFTNLDGDLSTCKIFFYIQNQEGPIKLTFQKSCEEKHYLIKLCTARENRCIVERMISLDNSSTFIEKYANESSLKTLNG